MAYLRILFLKTEQRLINEINRKRKEEYVDYAEVAALNRTQQILQGMVDESWSYVPQVIEKIFYRSDAAAKGYANAAGLTATQMNVVERLSDNLLGEIVEASVTAQRTVETFLVGRRDSGHLRESALKAVAREEAAGYGSKRAAVRMANELRGKEITAFEDKLGRKWGLQDYCNMAARSTARQAQVAAVIMADPDYDLYKIIKIGSTCPICAPLEGRVYSRSGNSQDYPPLAAAFGKIDKNGGNELSNTYLNIHPNCLHTIVKYTTMGKSEKDIQKDKDFSNFEKNPISVDPRSKKQIAAYKNKIKNRQKLLNDFKQFERYRGTLGNEVPNNFDKFRTMKYNEGEKETWKQTQAIYRKTNAYNTIIRNEPEITKDLREISKETGVRMVGMEHRIKTKESFLRKVDKKTSNSREQKTILEAVSNTNDVIRYTYQDNGLSLEQSYQRIGESLSGKGYTMVSLKNSWLNKADPYNGINCIFKSSSGQKFEIQFHTPESYNIKELMHKDYEEWRLLNPSSPEAVNIRKRMHNRTQGMEIPVNIEEVKI